LNLKVCGLASGVDGADDELLEVDVDAIEADEQQRQVRERAGNEATAVTVLNPLRLPATSISLASYCFIIILQSLSLINKAATLVDTIPPTDSE